MSILLAFALAQDRSLVGPDGVEVKSIAVDASIIENLAVTRIKLEIRNWGPAVAEADLRLEAPEGAVIADVDSTGATTPDIEAAMDPKTARSLVTRLRRTATTLARSSRPPDTNTLDLSEYLQPPAVPQPRPGPVTWWTGYRDPSLVEKSGDRAFRLSLWPLPPGREDHATFTAGASQTVSLFFIHALRKSGDAYVYEFPLKISGRAGKLPAASVKGAVYTGGDFTVVDGSMDSKNTSVGGTIAWTIQFTGEADAATCKARAPYDVDWALACLAAKDDAKKAQKLKVVTDGSSILLSDSKLHEAMGQKAPKSGPESLEKARSTQ